MVGLNERQQELLGMLRASRRTVTTGRVHELNRSLGAPKRTTARRDVAALHRMGLLVEGGRGDTRFYMLSRKAVS